MYFTQHNFNPAVNVSNVVWYFFCFIFLRFSRVLLILGSVFNIVMYCKACGVLGVMNKSDFPTVKNLTRQTILAFSALAYTVVQGVGKKCLCLNSWCEIKQRHDCHSPVLGFTAASLTENINNREKTLSQNIGKCSERFEVIKVHFVARRLWTTHTVNICSLATSSFLQLLCQALAEG